MSLGTCVRRSLVSTVLLCLWCSLASAHQDSCHRLHRCASDHGTYVCGDRGRCDQCPDNAFCQERKPRASAQTPAKPAPPGRTSAAHARLVKIIRVIDGDTLQLSTGEEVRLIGVNTPETKHPKKPVEYYGKEASAFTRQMVEGKKCAA
jgi:hypothetical protein